MTRLRTSLWFDTQALEAAEFYVSVIGGGIDAVIHDVGGNPHTAGEGTVLQVDFHLADMRLTGINGGPIFTFSEATSIVLECETQEEADRYWAALTEGGAESQCGWLKDRYGFSWQVVPLECLDYLGHADPAVAKRAVEAMLTMTRLDAAAMREAALGG